MTAFERNSFNGGKESKALNEAFDNAKSLEKFKEQMAQIEKDIDPRFRKQFIKYRNETLALLSGNLSVVASRVVQKELARQNARIARAFEKDSIKLREAYNNIFGGAVNNRDYGQEGLAA